MQVIVRSGDRSCNDHSSHPPFEKSNDRSSNPSSTAFVHSFVEAFNRSVKGPFDNALAPWFLRLFRSLVVGLGGWLLLARWLAGGHSIMRPPAVLRGLWAKTL